jgi:hypothetical protein
MPAINPPIDRDSLAIEAASERIPEALYDQLRYHGLTDSIEFEKWDGYYVPLLWNLPLDDESWTDAMTEALSLLNHPSVTTEGIELVLGAEDWVLAARSYMRGLLAGLAGSPLQDSPNDWEGAGFEDAVAALEAAPQGQN